MVGSVYPCSRHEKLDYVPLASTLTNLYCLFSRFVYGSHDVASSSRSPSFFTLRPRSTLRHILLLIPGLGNITIALYDFYFGKSASPPVAEQRQPSPEGRASTAGGSSRAIASSNPALTNEPITLSKPEQYNIGEWTSLEAMSQKVHQLLEVISSYQDKNHSAVLCAADNLVRFRDRVLNVRVEMWQQEIFEKQQQILVTQNQSYKLQNRLSNAQIEVGNARDGLQRLERQHPLLYGSLREEELESARRRLASAQEAEGQAQGSRDSDLASAKKLDGECKDLEKELEQQQGNLLSLQHLIEQTTECTSSTMPTDWAKRLNDMRQKHGVS